MPAAISHYLLARKVLDDPSFDSGKSFLENAFYGAPKAPTSFTPTVFSLAKREKLKGNRRTASSDPSFVDF